MSEPCTNESDPLPNIQPMLQMSPQQRGFFRDILHHIIRAGLQTAIWRLPLFWVVVAVACAIGAVVYFDLY